MACWPSNPAARNSTMPGLSGSPIVSRALELAKLHPHSATLDILDAAMEGRHGTHPDFECETCEFSDWLESPSPFAKLLRAAFGAHLDPEDVEGESPRWQTDVIDAFADRYGLWR